MYQINSKLHNVYLNKVNKLSLNSFDDKWYILNNGITTIPYGYNLN